MYIMVYWFLHQVTNSPAAMMDRVFPKELTRDMHLQRYGLTRERRAGGGGALEREREGVRV